MSVTKKVAQKSVKDFNDFFKTLPLVKRKDYYGNKKASIKSYKSCFSCGNTYKDFRIALSEEIPRGSTIQPIMHFDE